jgi:hypothetical protein
MKASQEHYAIGAALIEALEPIIDVCLTTGIGSPELEKILRVAFVNRAFDRLPRHPTSGRPATANQVAFATGLQWTDVAKVRSASKKSTGKKLPETREPSGSKSTKVIEGWITDPAFLTSGGHPSDLPIQRIGKHRSFKDLAKKYAPKTPFGTLLKELTRRGHVQVLDGEIVRFKRATAKRGGMTPSAIAEASGKVKRLADNLYQALNDGDSKQLYEESDPLKLSAEQIALLRPMLERRVKAFLQSVENEFRAEGNKDKVEEQEFGVSVFSWIGK